MKSAVFLSSAIWAFHFSYWGIMTVFIILTLLCEMADGQ